MKRIRPSIPKVAEYLHISEAFEHAAEFDLIHSHYDFMALTYTRLVKTPVLTTIHGFSSPKIMPVYDKYRDGYFVSISDSDRAPRLNYLATVYNGIDLSLYPLQISSKRALPCGNQESFWIDGEAESVCAAGQANDGPARAEM